MNTSQTKTQRAVQDHSAGRSNGKPTMSDFGPIVDSTGVGRLIINCLCAG